MRTYYFYIMSSESGVLYCGVTNDLMRRVWEHKNSVISGFTSKYRVKNLVYFEDTTEIESAILREKQVKKWSRKKKAALINSINPLWKDLSSDWYSED